MITGASGRIGDLLRAPLRKDYDLVLLSRSKVSKLEANEEFIPADITNYEQIQRAVEGIDMIVHLAAAVPRKGRSVRREVLPANIDGCYNVFEAARTASVERIVYGSTNHTTGFYPPEQMLDGRSGYRPDSIYGVTKCFGELLGQVYWKKAGLEVVCLRIGSCRKRPEDERQLATWISYPDMAHLTRCALEADGIGFAVFYGISNNTRRWWDIERAREVIGYEPQDNAEEFASELLEGPSSKWLSRIEYQGGPVAASGLGEFQP